VTVYSGTPTAAPVPPPPPRPPQAAPDRGTGALLGCALAGAAVAVTLGVYARLHHPTGIAVNLAGFSSPLAVKAWLASAAFLLALAQVASALVMYGKVPRLRAPGWISTAHQWSGRLAFLFAVPVAVHCMYALGFQGGSTRVLAHSLLGCAFFGAFTVKMLALTRRGLPGWALPVLGALVFTALAALWFTSALWFFGTFGVSR